jgi:rod shape-determining protein MreD
VLEWVNRPIVRLLMVGIPCLALQTTVLTRLTLGDMVVELMLLLSVAGGVVAGPESGALAGFLMGILFDLAYPADAFGLTALVYCVTAFVAGYANEFTVHRSWWLSITVVGVTSAGGMLLYPVAAVVVGVDGLLTADVLGLAVKVGLVNAFLAPLALPVMRWCLRVRRNGVVFPRADVISP